MFEYKKQKSKPTYTQPTKVVAETKKVISKECQFHRTHKRNCVDCERVK